MFDPRLNRRRLMSTNLDISRMTESIMH